MRTTADDGTRPNQTEVLPAPRHRGAPWVSMTSSKKVIGGLPAWNAEDVRFLATLAETGRFKPVIDRRYSFERITEAHRYVDTGRKRGNVVLTL